MIADANGLSSSSDLVEGMELTIPNKVTNVHNNTGTFRVYEPGEALGNISPTISATPMPPPPKKKSCGGFASIIVAAVAVVATIYTAGVLAGPAAITAAGGSTMAAGVGALGTAGGLSFGAAFAAGAAGSIAGQLAGNALGVQSGFSWGAVATAGLTSGILSTDTMRALTQAVSGAVNGGYAAVAARAVVGNVVGQGIGNITGTQKGFNWSSVAISGIGAAAGAAISDKLQLTSNYGAFTNGTNFGADLGRAAVSAGSFALTQLVVSGGKVNWQQVATDTVTNLIQNRAESNAVKAPATRQEQLIKRFNLDPEKNFTHNRFMNEMLYIERGGEVSEERRHDMVEFGIRQLGASESEVQTNLSLLNDAKYGLFTQATNSSATVSTPQIFNQGVSTGSTIYLDTISVTPEYALLSKRLDQIAIGTGQLVQDIGSRISNTPALKYSLEALDIIGAPLTYAALQAVAGTYIGDSIDEAKQYMFSKANGLFTNAGYDTLEANSGGVGVFAILSVGASGAKGLLDDVASIQSKLTRVNLSAETKRLMGDAPTRMINPHRHHILEVNGRFGDHRAIVREGQDILRGYGIDPIHGIENLVWAPNKGHTMDASQRLVDELRLAHEVNAPKSEIVDILGRHGKEASER